RDSIVDEARRTRTRAHAESKREPSIAVCDPTGVLIDQGASWNALLRERVRSAPARIRARARAASACAQVLSASARSRFCAWRPPAAAALPRRALAREARARAAVMATPVR